MTQPAPQALVPYIPHSAPFSPEQRAWLNGFLAGMFAKTPAEGQAPTAAQRPSVPVTILWGSQTGNAESLAKQAKKGLEAAGAAVNVFDLADYPREQLAQEKHLVVITSTYGEGDPPDNAADFHSFLLGDEAPRLEQTRFAVLALGDSNYLDFCQTGKDFDSRLETLGAQRLLDRIDCDVDFEEPFEVWLQGLSAKVGELAGSEHGGAPATLPDSTASSGASEEQPAFGKKNPFPAPVLTNLRLNGEVSAKDTRHIEFSLAGSGLSYEVGDALAVRPRNHPETVRALIAAAQLSPDAPVDLADGAPLEEVLLHGYDICKLTLGFLKDAALSCPNEELQQLVAAATEDRGAFTEFAWGRELIDVIEQFGIRWESADAFVGCLKKLAPRLYSISSSPKAHPDEVHLTVGVVRYESHGRARMGLCSNYLADIAPGGVAPVEVYIQPNKHFKPPQDASAPMIMVGPGTGIAPFRAFLEEREATGASGKNWLFFGDQRAACDFLYREQLEGWQQSGLLTRLDTAFSRDQAQKVYVQDRMREQGQELAAWLEAGGSFYVCGDASRMAKDVDTALREIVAAEITDGSLEAANAYVDQMAKAKRYVRDVY